MLTPESATMGNRQYPRTLTVTPMETPDTAIRLSIAYIARHPSTPIP